MTPQGETAWTTLISDFQAAHPEIPLQVESMAELELTTKAGAEFKLGVVPFDFAWSPFIPALTTWSSLGYIDEITPFYDWMDSTYPGDYLPAARFKTPGPKGVLGDYFLNIGVTTKLMHVRSDWISAAGLNIADVSGTIDKFEALLYALKAAKPAKILL
ncbi:MAG: hypothetical protein ABSB40_10575 [Nitrososphaeria archaeon]